MGKRKIEELGYGQSRLEGGSAFETHGGGTHDHKLPKGTRKKKNGTLKPMRFVSLHHHTTFSYLDGFELPEAHVRRATEINMGAIAFTEHGNISSHVKAEVAAQAAGVKPLFGCEIYTGRVGDDATQKKYHLTVLAKNATGYANLMQLVSASWKEGFYHEPTVSWEMLQRHREGLVILSGCQGSLLFCAAVGGKLISESDASYGRAKKVAQRFKRVFGDSYFIEVQAFPELEKTRRFNPIAERLGRELSIGIVGTMDCHYTAPDKAEIQKVLHSVRPGERRTVEDLERDWGYEVPLCPPSTDASIFRRLRESGLSRNAALQAIVNTELIAQECTVELPKLPMLRYPVPHPYTSADDLFMDWLKQGWKFRGLHKLSKSEQRKYKAVLKKEIGVIREKDFIDYFLVVSDSVKFAKDEGIPVGPARGSAAASLVCWLLRITEVNPVLFPNLVFERFIDVSRADLPDIDLDFPAWSRPVIRDYLVAKYGETSVANIGTFTYYKAKLALDDVGKVHHVPRHDVETVKELLVERSSGDLRASATIEDTVQHFEAAGEVVARHPNLRKAMDLEGNVKTFGVHAAGLVVANGDIRDVTALLQRTIDGNEISVVSMDKYDAERQGLLKLDYLALSTLDMIDGALGHLGMSLQELYAIPLEEPSIIEGFRENDCTGIFQFDGRAARSINQALKPDTFVEICDVIALCRPGPLHSGAAGDYIDTKWGRRQREDLHQALSKITEATHGQIVYQEQILRVVTEIGGFDWTSSSAIRRIMSKKQGSAAFNQAWEHFKEGALTYHERHPNAEPFTLDLTEYVWGRLITAGAYAFNFAHCVSYGMLGAWAMWIKRNHPEVFYASALAYLPEGKNKVPTQWEALMRDAVSKGIELKPPRCSRPTMSWTPSEGSIRAGLVQIKGVGKKTSPLMIEYAEEHKPKHWEAYKAVRGIGPGTIAKIKEFAGSKDPFQVSALPNLIDKVGKEIYDLGLPAPTHKGEDIPYEKSLDVSVTYLGRVVQRNLRDIFESHRAKTGDELDPADVKDPDLRELVVLLMYDGTEPITARITRYSYPQLKGAIWAAGPKDLVLIQGTKPAWRTAREVYVNKMWVIDPEDD
jgi:DNA polymerase III subunit alpha